MPRSLLSLPPPTLLWPPAMSPPLTLETLRTSLLVLPVRFDLLTGPVRVSTNPLPLPPQPTNSRRTSRERTSWVHGTSSPSVYLFILQQGRRRTDVFISPFPAPLSTRASGQRPQRRTRKVSLLVVYYFEELLLTNALLDSPQLRRPGHCDSRRIRDLDSRRGPAQDRQHPRRLSLGTRQGFASHHVQALLHVGRLRP